MAGATTQADRQQQVLAAGYNGPLTDAAINQAYANAATPGDLSSSGVGLVPQSSGGGSGGGGGSQSSLAQQLTDATAPLSQATSGVTAAQLAENKRQFDATLAQQQRMWELQGLPELQIAQRTQAAQQAEYEAQQQIARGNLALAQTTQAQSNANAVAGLTGTYYAPSMVQSPQLPTAADFAAQDQATRDIYNQYHGANAAADWAREAGAAVQAAIAAQPQQQQGPGVQTLAAQQQQFAQGLQQGQLGLQYLTQAAQLGGPANYFQSVAFNRGAQQQGQMPAFLSALANNTGLAAFNGPGSAAAAPGPQTMGSLAGGLTAAVPGLNYGTGDGTAALSKIGALGAAGGQALSPQALENLNPDELDLFKSGLKATGYSAPAFLQQYAQSRVGQSAAQAY